MKVRVTYKGQAWEGVLRPVEQALPPGSAVNLGPKAKAVPVIQYVDLDEDGEQKDRPKWQLPETEMQRAFLHSTYSKWFQPRVKQQLKGIEGATRAGDMLGDNIYTACLREWEDVTAMPDALGKKLLPRSWFEWRMQSARDHRWSQKGTIHALHNIDALMQHCKFKLRELDKAQESRYNEESDEVPAWVQAMKETIGE